MLTKEKVISNEQKELELAKDSTSTTRIVCKLHRNGFWKLGYEMRPDLIVDTNFYADFHKEFEEL